MGISSFFYLGESNALFYEKFTLINKNKSRIKVFEPFEDSSKPSFIIRELITNSKLQISISAY
ncbi:putative Hantavirus glycoprotein G1 [Prochlorococcus marinus str. MIT 9302]|uniref:Putative Hantavirus glycoprotein G1 n=1 Tax=Prochlorococcus marinus str. MIT 9302 TaxID=74545 RepID=A0A0A2A8P1_PROMR|nr:putative Hantavirus glycoprotein G1 [Prochlorococcus marinus str. MIT 9302]